MSIGKAGLVLPIPLSPHGSSHDQRSPWAGGSHRAIIIFSRQQLMGNVRI